MHPPSRKNSESGGAHYRLKEMSSVGRSVAEKIISPV